MLSIDNDDAIAAANAWDDDDAIPKNHLYTHTRAKYNNRPYKKDRCICVGCVKSEIFCTIIQDRSMQLLLLLLLVVFLLYISYCMRFTCSHSTGCDKVLEPGQKIPPKTSSRIRFGFPKKSIKTSQILAQPPKIHRMYDFHIFIPNICKYIEFSALNRISNIEKIASICSNSSFG